jgi:hypothetical protein
MSSDKLFIPAYNEYPMPFDVYCQDPGDEAGHVGTYVSAAEIIGSSSKNASAVARIAAEV